VASNRIPDLLQQSVSADQTLAESLTRIQDARVSASNAASRTPTKGPKLSSIALGGVTDNGSKIG
jgi:hypothetical protein